MQFVKYTLNTEADGTSFIVDTTMTSTMDNPETPIGEEEVFLAHLHQGQTVTDIMKQFVRFDTDPGLFRVFDMEGNKIDPDLYDLTPASTGLQIRLYSKSTDADNKYADYIRTILYGDLTGEGDVDVVDYIAMKNVLLSTSNYESLGILYLAGLIGDSSELDVVNYVTMKNYLLDETNNDFNSTYLV